MTDDLHWTFHPLGLTGEFQSAWDAFNAATLRTPLLDCSFVTNALRQFGNGHEQLAVAEDGRGTAAMSLLRTRGPAVVETFQPSQLPVCPWLQRADLGLAALAQSMVRDHAGPIVLAALTQLDPLLVAQPPEGPLLKTVDYITTGSIALDDSFDRYMADRSGNLLANLRRRQRNAEHEYGTISLQVVDAPGDVEAALMVYSRLESAGWKARLGTAIERGNRQWLFYLDAMTTFCRQGQGRVFVLRFGDQIAAAALAIVRESTAYMLKTTHNENLKSLSPGTFLRREVIAELYRREPSVRRIEMYGPLNASQRPWINGTREMYHLNAYRTRTISGLHSLSKLVRHFPSGREGDRAPQPAAMPAAIPPRSDAYDCFDSIPQSARSSLGRDESQEVFYSLDWFELLASEVFAEGVSPKLIHAVAEHGDQMAHMMLPMVSVPADPHWYRARRLQGLANYYSSLYGPITAGANPDDVETLTFGIAKIIADSRPRWDVVDLHPLDVSSAFWEVIQRALRQAGYLTDGYYCFGNWYLPVQVSTFDEYLAGRPSQLKSALKSGTKRTFRDPSAALTIVSGPGPDLKRAIEAYELTYSRSWKYSEPYPHFIPRLCELAAHKGWLRLGLLRIGDKPIAAQVWLVKDGKASIYKVAYDQDFAKHSPGTVLTAALMKHVIEIDKVSEVDYLAGDDAYKRGWMSRRRQRRGIVAFNPRSMWGLALAGSHFGGKVIRSGRRRLKFTGDATLAAEVPADSRSNYAGPGSGIPSGTFPSERA